MDLNSQELRYPYPSNFFSAFPYKSFAYEHEREVRAVFWKPGLPVEWIPEQEREMGHLVKVDLNKMIEKVIVSPLADSWYEKLVRVLCQQYGFEFEVGNSVMASKPIF